MNHLLTGRISTQLLKTLDDDDDVVASWFQIGVGALNF